MRAYRKIDDHFEVKIEKGRLVVLGVGAGLTLLLVFLVGVLVGKGLWGARPELSVPPPPLASASVPAQEPERPQYTFYDDLKRPDSTMPKAMPAAVESRENVGETAVPAPKPAGGLGALPEAPSEPVPPVPEKVREKSADAEKKPEKTASAAVAKPPAAEKAAKSAKPSTEPKTAETAKAATPMKSVDPQKAASAEKAPAAARAQVSKPAETAAKPAVETKLGAPSYTVQVGSFKDRASAEDQAKKIAGQGVSAQVVLAPMEGRTWYRVQVGQYGARAEAESYYQKKLRPKGIQGFVTQK